MKNKSLQLMLYKKNIQDYAISLEKGVDITLKQIHRAENRNYIFIDLEFTSTTAPQVLKFKLSSNDNNKSTFIDYPLYKKQYQQFEPITAADVIYLIMPDRFCNGDTTNDKLTTYKENPLYYSRDSIWGRHGGDLQGVVSKLDYLKDLGITTLWLTPIIENDVNFMSYHGYAFTNHYQIDKRFGGNDAYKNLVKQAHQKGIKIMQDAVYNHVGLNHFTVLDNPYKNWLNEWDTFTNTNHQHNAVYDIHANAMDKNLMINGWFVPSMPDMNHHNIFVKNFLIQNAIWYVEEFNIDGFRIDTYPYNDVHFMNACNQALLNEYPHLYIFGETTETNVLGQAFYTKNNLDIPFKSNLDGVTDFELQKAMLEALTQESTWDKGVSKLYTVLCQDFVYKHPNRNCVFLDNHDKDRFFSIIDENINKFKIGITWMLTLRGVPQIYYGTEIAMTGKTFPTDAYVRKDFLGGWKEDKINKFTQQGRTNLENEAFNFIKKVLTIRKNNPALYQGALEQLSAQQNDIYIYKKYDDKDTIFVVSNVGLQTKTLPLKFFKQYFNLDKPLTNLLDNRIITPTSFSLSPQSIYILK